VRFHQLVAGADQRFDVERVSSHVSSPPTTTLADADFVIENTTCAGRVPSGDSELGVTVKGHLASLRPASWQTHSPEGEPDQLLSRSQPV
jgi:hypothetical protein